MEGRASVLAGRRVLLAVCGGIAAYKSASLVRLLTGEGADVNVVMTRSAARFVGPDTFAALTRNPVHADPFEHPESVLHVRLAREAEVAVVAPATANVMAKLVLGLADDLVTSVLLEASCPLVVAPAMHSGMWKHPATRGHVEALSSRGVLLVGPADGPLAAGDEGLGRMAEPGEILEALRAVLGPADLTGVQVLVTAGPTHEPIDAVRYIGNRSSGRMGFEVAAEAARRGARVTLVTGPVSLSPPPAVEVVRVETALDMQEAVNSRFADVDAVVMAAAVADFRPTHPHEGKLKKDAGPPGLALTATEDILAGLSKRRERQVLIGFAAETGNLEAEGRRKLADKDLDLLVVNEVGRAGTGFDAETNRAGFVSRGGRDEPVREWTKRELARAICDRLAALVERSGRTPER